jgi:heme-degrading monooxygenase HmoA
VLVNVFQVAPEQTETLISAWADDARYFKAQPGFISTQLHRGISGSGTYQRSQSHPRVSPLLGYRAALALAG